MLVATPEGQQNIVAALNTHTTGAESGPFFGATLALSTVAVATGVTLAYSALTLPTYAGYEDQAVTWTGPTRLEDDNYGLVGNKLTFQEASTITETVIAAYALYVGTSPNQVILAVENLDPPKDLNDALDALNIIPVLDLPVVFASGATIVT